MSKYVMRIADAWTIRIASAAQIDPTSVAHAAEQPSRETQRPGIVGRSCNSKMKGGRDEPELPHLFFL
jgi:hypothetical protein